MTNNNHTCHRIFPSLNIRLAPFDRDERAVYVDSILNVLVESRFGLGHIFETYELQFCDVSVFVNYDQMPTAFEEMPFGGFSLVPVVARRWEIASTANAIAPCHSRRHLRSFRNIDLRQPSPEAHLTHRRLHTTPQPFDLLDP